MHEALAPIAALSLSATAAIGMICQAGAGKALDPKDQMDLLDIATRRHCDQRPGLGFGSAWFASSFFAAAL